MNDPKVNATRPTRPQDDQRGPRQEDACSECGTYSWRLALVDEGGNRTCSDCISGLTRLRKNGVPI